MKKLYVLGLLVLASGCATPRMAVTKTTPVKSYDKTYSAILRGLAGDGFIIKAGSKDARFISAEKAIPITRGILKASSEVLARVQVVFTDAGAQSNVQYFCLYTNAYGQPGQHSTCMEQDAESAGPISDQQKTIDRVLTSAE